MTKHAVEKIRPSLSLKESPLLFWLLITNITFFSLILLLLDYLIDGMQSLDSLYILIYIITIAIYLNPITIIYVASLCSLLIILSSFFHQNPFTDLIYLLNRFLIIFSIWVVALLGFIQLRYKRENQYAEERFRIAFESAPYSMLLISPDFRIVLVNKETMEIFGYSRKEFIGEKIERLIPQGLPLEQYAQGQSLSSSTPNPTFTALKADGTEFPVELGLSPLLLNESIYFLVSLIDVSDRQRLDQLKGQFSGIVAHELRTPLAVVSGILDNFYEGIEGPLEDYQKEIMLVAKDNLDNLYEIINHLLMLSRVETGQYAPTLQKIDLNLHLERISKGLMSLAARRNIEFMWHAPDVPLPLVKCNPSLVKQIVYNLFSNALKHAKTRIHLRLYPLPAKGGNGAMACVELSDDGPGIAPDKTKLIFERFYQVDGDFTSTNEYGLGLGLSLSKEMTKMQNGKIWVESKLGHGARFFFTLPYA